MRPRPLRLALSLALLLPSVPTHAADAVDRLLAAAAANCAAIDGGVMTAPERALIHVDLSGDGAPDALLDESRLECSTAASAFQGSGGSMLHAIVGESVTSWQATGWRLMDWNQDKLLLIGRDGGWCGASGAERCYEAVVWSAGRFLSLAPADSRTEEPRKAD